MSLNLNKIIQLFLLSFALIFTSSCDSASENNSSSSRVSSRGVADSSTTKPGEEAGEATPDDLESMPIGELYLLEQERREQDKSEEEELVLLDAINTELCKKLSDKRSYCPAVKRLIVDSTEKSLRCDGSIAESEENTEIKIGVTLTSSNITDKFKLIANDLYESSPFTANKPSIITFRNIGGGSFQAPQFLKVHKLVLRTATEEPAVLPSLSGMKIQISVNDLDLLDQYLTQSHDAIHKENNTEYSISVEDILQLRLSSTCMVNQNDIDTVKDNLRNAIVQDQIISRKEEYKNNIENIDFKNAASLEGNRGGLISSINGLRASIEYRFPLLEGERNRQFKLANELKTDIEIGCHARQPIKSFEIEIEGSVTSVDLGKKSSWKHDQLGDGGDHELYFDFGGVKFSIDFKTENIFGSRYIFDKDVSTSKLISSLERVHIRKKGTSFTNLAMACKSGGGVIQQIGSVISNSTCYNVTENGVFSISAMTIYANGKKAYEKRDLQISFDEKTKQWSDNLQKNEEWVKLMLDEDCNITN